MHLGLVVAVAGALREDQRFLGRAKSLRPAPDSRERLYEHCQEMGEADDRPRIPVEADALLHVRRRVVASSQLAVRPASKHVAPRAPIGIPVLLTQHDLFLGHGFHTYRVAVKHPVKSRKSEDERELVRLTETARHGDSLGGASAVGDAQIPRRPCRVGQDSRVWLGSWLREARLGPMEVLQRGPDLALVKQRLTELGEGAQQEPGIAVLLRSDQELLGQLARGVELGPDEMKIPQALQHAEELGRVAELTTAAERPRVGLADLGGGVASSGHPGRPEPQEKRHLALGAWTIVGQRRQQLERAREMP